METDQNKTLLEQLRIKRDQLMKLVYSQRYPASADDETDEARHKRLMNNPDAWTRWTGFGGGKMA